MKGAGSPTKASEEPSYMSLHPDRDAVLYLSKEREIRYSSLHSYIKHGDTGQIQVIQVMFCPIGTCISRAIQVDEKRPISEAVFEMSCISPLDTGQTPNNWTLRGFRHAAEKGRKSVGAPCLPGPQHARASARGASKTESHKGWYVN